jgi:MFS family permease
MWLAAGLREPERATEERHGMRSTIATSLRIVRGNRPLLAVIIFTAALWTVSALVHLYAQAVLAARGLPPSQIGLVFGVTLFATALGAWLAGRLTGFGSFRVWVVAATAAIAGSGVLLGGAPVLWAVLGLVVSELFAGALEPMVAQQVNTAITSAQRATILSIESLLYSVTIIWAFPLFGWAAERWGWLPAYAASAGIAAALLAIFLLSGGGRPLSRPLAPHHGHSEA